MSKHHHHDCECQRHKHEKCEDKKGSWAECLCGEGNESFLIFLVLILLVLSCMGGAII
jgi:hypothetical protein